MKGVSVENKKVLVRSCNSCPFVRCDPTFALPQDECWLNIDVVPAREGVPPTCPLKTSVVTVLLDLGCR
jgi:hypothetical protein